MNSDPKINTLLQDANRQLDNNQVQSALGLYDEIIKLDPDNSEAWLMKGAIFGELGRIEDARIAINKSLEIDPDYTDAHLTLGHFNIATGNPVDAINNFRNAVKSSPEDEEAHFSLASTLVKESNYQEAMVHAIRATEIDDSYSEAWQLLGWLQHINNNFADAEKSYRKAIQLNPDIADNYLHLGIILTSTGQHSEAESYLKRYMTTHPDDTRGILYTAINLLAQGNVEYAYNHLNRVLQLDPNNALAHYHMSIVYQYRGQYRSAEKHIRQALSVEPANKLFHYSLAGVLSSLGDMPAAETAIKKALEIDPSYDRAKAGLAELYEKQGKLQESYDLLVPTLSKQPPNIHAALVYSRLARHFDEVEKCINLLDNIDRQKELSSFDKIALYNSLGRLHDISGNYDTAFEFYEKSASSKQQSYDKDRQEAITQDIIRTVPTALSGEDSNNKLIFIIGLPRSGTTLAEQILASHPDIYGAGELIGLSRLIQGNINSNTLSIPQLRNDIQDRLKSRAPVENRIVINERPIFQHLDTIKSLFPDAIFIHCTRDPVDTCLSCFFQLLSEEYAYSYDLDSLAHYYSQYSKIMQHWTGTHNIPLFELNYETLISDAETTTRQLIEYCGLEWNDDCLNFHENKRDVHTPSYGDVRKPIYNSSVKRWKNYEKHIGPLTTLITT